MRVLVISESREVWGAERSLLEIVEFARAQEVELAFVLGRNSPLVPILEAAGFKVYEHEFATASSGVTRSLKGLGSLKILRKLYEIALGTVRLRKIVRGYDAVLNFSIWQAAESLLAARTTGVRFGIDFHESFSSKRGFFLAKVILSLSDFVVAPSKAILRSAGFTRTRALLVVPRPVHDRFAADPRHIVGKKATVGIFGQIQPHKRVYDVVAALMNNDSVELSVVGGESDPAKRTAYEDSVRDLVSTNPRFKVVDRTDDVSDLMKRTHVVINASEHEAFGRTVAEALYAGAHPIVVGDWGPAEIVEMSGIGSVIGGVADLNGSVDSFIDDQAIQATPTRELYLEARQSFNAERIATTYFDFVGAEVRRRKYRRPIYRQAATESVK